MASKYWIKLWHEILHDLKMAQLRDRLYRRVIECFLFAGQEDDDGYLPDLNQMAWTLHSDPETLETEFNELAQLGILQILEGRWHVTHFAGRQAKMSKAEYMRRKRESERKAGYYQPVSDSLPDSDQPVTNGNTDKIRRDKDKETEEEESIKAASAAEYHEIRLHWLALFPDKPKPREANKTLEGRAKTRMKSAHFRDNWQPALLRAAKSSFLLSGTFFDLAWFLKNDGNYEKCLNGNYDDHENGTGPRQTKVDRSIDTVNRMLGQ